VRELLPVALSDAKAIFRRRGLIALCVTAVLGGIAAFAVTSTNAHGLIAFLDSVGGAGFGYLTFAEAMDWFSPITA
jgi:NAD/NADP transhydrogenase beta subunit